MKIGFLSSETPPIFKAGALEGQEAPGKTQYPDKAPTKDRGTAPDLIDFLKALAFLTSVVSSVELKFSIDSRCRGANGEVAGEVAVVKHRLCWGFSIARRYKREGRSGGIVETCAVALLIEGTHKFN